MHVPPRIRPQASVPPAAAVPAPVTDPAQLSAAGESLGGVRVEARAPVPTPLGVFDMVVVRMHSECLTSEVFHSLKCDCREQLHASLEEVARRDLGVVLYLRQEGRGIGLANKIRAYALQAHGADTVDANRMLGLPDDARRYDMAALMLRHLGVESVRLMTNNPQKVDDLRALGVHVVERLPMIVPPNPYSAGYLEAKRLRMRHQLPGSAPRLRAVGDADAE